MSQDGEQGLRVIQQQLKELDGILHETMGTLNTTAGTERVAKWKAKTVTLLTEAVGAQAGQDFLRIQPGPSFTNDLIEEFSDLVECFRVPLTTLSKTLSQAGHRPGGGG